uniref:Uncharacterized protein n=1 Tax=Arundo donax TaxID=35708 RepID=A0A0A9DEE6_ARUDO
MGFTCSMVITDGRAIRSPVIGLTRCSSDLSSAVINHPLEDPIRNLVRMGGSGRVSLYSLCSTRL